MSRKTLSGRVLRISHTFKGCSADYLFVELWCWDTLQHIQVDKPSQMDWFSSLQVDASYKFTSLMEGKVQALEGDDIPVYVANPLSGTTVTKLSVEEEDDEKKHKYMKVGEIHDSSLTSYQGKVVAVLDGEAGVYRLEEGRVLYITHLKDMTAELWSWEEHSTEEHDTEAIPLHRCLEKGDEVQVDGCHELSSSNDYTLLVCCGRSVVVNLSRPFIPQPRLSYFPLPWEVWAVHKYGLSQGGIAWLLEQKAVVASLTSQLSLEGHVMETLLRETVTHKLFVHGEDMSRPGEQFLRHSSNCPVVREFLPPYKLVMVEEVANVLELPKKMVPCHENVCPYRVSAGIQPIPAWHCWSFSIGPKTPYILLGKLVADERKGVLKIECCKSVDAVLMNTKQGFVHEVGSIVGVYNFLMVSEEFLVQQQEVVIKNYILCNSSSFMILENNIDTKLPANSYECEVLDKGPLISFHTKGCIGFWPLCFFNLRVNFASHPKREKKTEINMVKVKKGNLHLFPILTTGDMLQIHPGKKEVATALNRNEHCAWTQKRCIVFDDSVYLCKEPSQRPCKLNYLRIKTALSVQQDKYCVQGIVVSKHFQKPNVESEFNVVPVKAFKDHNIGTPMGKKTILVLKDSYSDDNVVVYLASSCHNLVTSYPLGILPHMEVQVSLLMKKTLGNGKPYFVGTNMTEVQPVCLPEATIPPQPVCLPEATIPPQPVCLPEATIPPQPVCLPEATIPPQPVCLPEATIPPQPVCLPEATIPPQPVCLPEATIPPQPVCLPEATIPPQPVCLPEATISPQPVCLPEATISPQPVCLPEATISPQPVCLPEATISPQPVCLPEATISPQPVCLPEATIPPQPVCLPEATIPPQPVCLPEATISPQPVCLPEATIPPQPVCLPEATISPQPVCLPEATIPPQPVCLPEATIPPDFLLDKRRSTEAETCV